MMLTPLVKLIGSSVIVVLVCGALSSRAQATVFRDRTAFNAASQNLRTIDFESAPAFENTLVIDGVIFQSMGGASIGTGQNGNKFYRAHTVGEITRLTITLPPGTTAVACDEFVTPMLVEISTGESVTRNESDTSTFVGFVTDQPIQTMIVWLDFPEPTPTALVDNVSYGQRRAGNEPPVPQLLVTTNTGRAAALDSVTTESEPFHVLSAFNRAPDGHTRITLFLVGIALEPADLAFVTVQAEDTQQHVFDLPVEGTRQAGNPSWVSQVTIRVPDALAGAGNLNVSITVRGKVSNKAPLRIE